MCQKKPDSQKQCTEYVDTEIPAIWEKVCVRVCVFVCVCVYVFGCVYVRACLQMWDVIEGVREGF